MKPLQKKVAVLAGLACLLVALTAWATIIGNGAPDWVAGGRSDFDPCPPYEIPFQMADDFVLAGDFTIADVHWWGNYGPSNTPTGPDLFAIRLFEDVGGLPGVVPFYEWPVLAVDRVATGEVSQIGDRDVFEYWASIDPVELPPGTYWLSIVNDTSADLDDAWSWASSTWQEGNGMVRSGDDQEWEPLGPLSYWPERGFAFELSDTTLPAILTNAPPRISPQDAPVEFSAWVRDAYPGDPQTWITGWESYGFNPKGKKIPRSGKCDIEIDGDTLFIGSTAGAGTFIEFTAVAMEGGDVLLERTFTVRVVD